MGQNANAMGGVWAGNLYPSMDNFISFHTVASNAVAAVLCSNTAIPPILSLRGIQVVEPWERQLALMVSFAAARLEDRSQVQYWRKSMCLLLVYRLEDRNKREPATVYCWFIVWRTGIRENQPLSTVGLSSGGQE